MVGGPLHYNNCANTPVLFRWQVVEWLWYNSANYISVCGVRYRHLGSSAGAWVTTLPTLAKYLFVWRPWLMVLASILHGDSGPGFWRIFGWQPNSGFWRIFGPNSEFWRIFGWQPNSEFWRVFGWQPQLRVLASIWMVSRFWWRKSHWGVAKRSRL